MRNRKINKVKVSIVLIIIVVLLLYITGFGRFLYNSVKDRYLTSRNFYFTSNLLDIDTPSYRYHNWSGADTYKLDFELYSFQNELLRIDYDLEYTVTCTTTSSKVTCAIASTEGTNTDEGIIYKASGNEEVVSIYLTPKEGVEFDLGETVTISVMAYTTEPYAKTISADFIFEITAQGADYQIEDKANQNYALVKLKNTLALDSNVTLKFDPSVVRLDMNDEVYLNNIGYKVDTESGYINEITFLMPKESSKNIKFYKVDKTQDYTTQLDIFEVLKTGTETDTEEKINTNTVAEN